MWGRFTNAHCKHRVQKVYFLLIDEIFVSFSSSIHYTHPYDNNSLFKNKIDKNLHIQ